MFCANPPNPLAPSRIKVGLRWVLRWRRKRRTKGFVKIMRGNFNGKKRIAATEGRGIEEVYMTERKDEKGIRLRNGTRYRCKKRLCGNTLLGDEANMHAPDPAKVHLDHIALHYAVLQWCSISPCGATGWHTRGKEGQVREGGNGTSRVSCISLVTRLRLTLLFSFAHRILWPLRSPDATSLIVPCLERGKGRCTLNNLRGTSGLELYCELCHTCIPTRVDTRPCLNTATGSYTRRPYSCMCERRARRVSSEVTAFLGAWIIARRLSRACAADIAGLYFSGVFPGRVYGEERARERETRTHHRDAPRDCLAETGYTPCTYYTVTTGVSPAEYAEV